MAKFQRFIENCKKIKMFYICRKVYYLVAWFVETVYNVSNQIW